MGKYFPFKIGKKERKHRWEVPGTFPPTPRLQRPRAAQVASKGPNCLPEPFGQPEGKLFILLQGHAMRSSFSLPFTRQEFGASGKGGSWGRVWQPGSALSSFPLLARDPGRPGVTFCGALDLFSPEEQDPLPTLSCSASLGGAGAALPWGLRQGPGLPGAAPRVPPVVPPRSAAHPGLGLHPRRPQHQGLQAAS